MSKAGFPLGKLFDYSKKYKASIYTSTLYSILNKVFDVAPEILIGVAIDVVVKRQDSWLSKFGFSEVKTQLFILAILTFLIWFFESYFEYLHLTGWRGLAQKIQNDLRLDTFKQVLKLDLSYFENQKSGNLVSILNDDINQLERFLDGGANSIIQLFTVSILVGGVFFAIEPEVAVWAMLPIPIIMLGAFYFKKRAEPLYAGVRDQAGSISSRLTQSLAGMLVIKSQNAENYELETLKALSDRYKEANQFAIKVSSAFVPIVRMAVLAGFLATLVVGGIKALNGELEVGAFGVLVFLTQRLLWPMTGIATTVDLYQRAMASVHRIFDLLNQPVAIKSGELSFAREDAKRKNIEFKDVSFSYEHRIPVLKNINLTIMSGKMLAIVGSTGSGKSTLSKLLLRFYDVNAGKIFLGDQNIASYSIRDLRNQIGYVAQDSFLLDGSIRENVAFGDKSLRDEDIWNALQIAECKEFVVRLAKGLDTLVGERGQKLSGGQKQRLAIARAVVRNPPILIFDEATSAVDNETELLIQRSIANISKNRTLLVIAHRLSTIRHADQIVVLDQGELKEIGKHEELLKKDGAYRKLWDIQFGGIV